MATMRGRVSMVGLSPETFRALSRAPAIIDIPTGPGVHPRPDRGGPAGRLLFGRAEAVPHSRPFLQCDDAA